MSCVHDDAAVHANTISTAVLLQYILSISVSKSSQASIFQHNNSDLLSTHIYTLRSSVLNMTQPTRYKTLNGRPPNGGVPPSRMFASVIGPSAHEPHDAGPPNGGMVPHGPTMWSPPPTYVAPPPTYVQTYPPVYVPAPPPPPPPPASYSSSSEYRPSLSLLIVS